MRGSVTLLCLVAAGALIALGDDPLPPCVLHVDWWTDGSCAACPSEENPDYCENQITYYDWFCPENGACAPGYHCTYVETVNRIAMIIVPCLNCCDDPNDPHCEWDRDNTQTYELPFPKECICFQDV